MAWLQLRPRWVKRCRMTDTVLIIDFGSQVTQLIARRVREAGVYSEIVPFNRAEGALERLAAEGRDPVRRPRQRHAEMGSPRAPDWVFKSGLPVLGDLLRRADHGRTARRRSGRRARRRVRPRRDRGHRADCALFDGIWQVGKRDTVWMSHGDRVTQAAGRLHASRPSARARRSRSPATRRPASTRCSSTPRSCTRRDGASADRQLRAQDRGPRRRLDDGAFPHERDREDPRAGRQGPRHLRPVGRRRLGGGGEADPRGDRRPAHLHLRRPRPDAPQRGRRGRRRCSAAPSTFRSCTSMPPRRSSASWPASPTPSRSARSSAACSSRRSRRRRRRSAARSSSPRARSIPT